MSRAKDKRAGRLALTHSTRETRISTDITCEQLPVEIHPALSTQSHSAGHAQPSPSTEWTQRFFGVTESNRGSFLEKRATLSKDGRER